MPYITNVATKAFRSKWANFHTGLWRIYSDLPMQKYCRHASARFYLVIAEWIGLHFFYASALKVFFPLSFEFFHFRRTLTCNYKCMAGITIKGFMCLFNSNLVSEYSSYCLRMFFLVFLIQLSPRIDSSYLGKTPIGVSALYYGLRLLSFVVVVVVGPSQSEQLVYFKNHKNVLS